MAAASKCSSSNGNSKTVHTANNSTTATSKQIIVKNKIQIVDQKSQEIPLIAFLLVGAFAAAFLSASWVVPFLLTKLHGDFIKPYLNSLRWDEEALWRMDNITRNDSTALNKRPWKYDWFPCRLPDEQDTGPIVEPFHPLYDTPPKTPQEALDSILYHGMTVLPQALPSHQASVLNTFVRRRNDRESALESIPVLVHSQHKTFRLNLREDPSIPAALHALASNRLLTETLEGLVGENPAIVELSTITAQPGAKAQPWHSDTNRNTMIYENHFTHLFTVLIPLQDTTFEMGATWVCPGTHRCRPQRGYCDKYGYSITTSNSSSDGDNVSSTSGSYWKAGDALVYSSDIHHHGGAHVHWDGPPRTVLILSVTSRPDQDFSFGNKWMVPLRTLPLGPVFGIRYDHWGLTWKQLQDPQLIRVFMGATENCVFRWLRALGLFSLDGDEGWTFIQSIWVRSTRINAMGYRFIDLEEFHKSRICPFLSGLPWFLQGRIEKIHNDYSPWPRYLSDIVGKFRNAAILLNFVILAWLLTKFFPSEENKMQTTDNLDGKKQPADSSASTSRKKRKHSFAIAFGVAYGGVCLAGSVTWIRISSQVSILMAERNALINGQNASKSQSTTELRKVKTSVPVEEYYDQTVAADFQDIILMKRSASASQAEFSRQWVDYNPGNLRWKSAITRHAHLWLVYHGLPAAFTEAVVRNCIMASVDGRFVAPNELGDWEEMVRANAVIETQKELQKQISQSMPMQRWGPPVVRQRKFNVLCESPRLISLPICKSTSAHELLTTTILQHIAPPRSQSTLETSRAATRRIEQPKANADPSEAPMFPTDRIEARLHRGSHWVNGQVTQLYELGGANLYDIEFDFGGFHEMLPERFVRRKRRAQWVDADSSSFYQIKTASFGVVVARVPREINGRPGLQCKHYRSTKLST